MTSECSSLHCYVTINPANASKQRISQSQLNTAKSYKAFEALGKDSLFDVWWSFNQGFINQSPIIIPGFPLNGNADSWVGDISALLRCKIYILTCFIYLNWQRDICMRFLLNPNSSAFISCKPIFKRFCTFKRRCVLFQLA